MAALATPSDQDLTIRLIAGEHEAFRAIYDRYWKKLLHFAAHRTGDLAEAENLVQDVFVALWNRREQLEIRSTLASYLTVSVKYRIINWLDRQRSIRLMNADGEAVVDLLDQSTQEYLELSQLKDVLDALINELPQQAQLVFKLSYEQQLSHREIAEETGLSEKAVNAHLVRSRKTLRLRLGSFLHSWLL